MYDKWPRPLDERTTRRRGVRGRDKVTGMPDGKRWCPAYEGIISPTTCRESRGKIDGCDARCPYFAPLIVGSRTLAEPSYPVHRCFVRHLPQSGAATVIVSRRNPDGTLRVMSLLLDMWKVGIQDCFVDVRVTEEELQKDIEKAVPAFEEKSLEECQRLVKWAETISHEIGYEIAWDYTRWNDILGDMSQVRAPEGSLYRCAKCGENLPEKAVELMKRYALRPDVQFYLVCRKCGGEFEDDW